ncbi:MAG: dihydropteroate synthase [Gammaproteobacteria bacterium]|jgi:dihydropteroate synthase|nr:dihydropteroate synthase [Gammaproteobacteria bacterium]MBK81222.1 dihydropteroate synthase [Gammaproteobacteria bacterium]|tara:strand:+ start:2553 stop:3347 length:795 start_codon:yes stop_codon:yes gene_type:complete
MGVINVTPDSFSDGGRFVARDAAVDLGRVAESAQAMLEAGAAVLDVGGESTRPGAAAVSEAEETRRVMPVLERLLDLDAVISLDTSKPELAARALASGVHLVNDVGGGRDPRMLEVLAASTGAYCVMHMQGEPRTMQQDPQYRDVVTEVRDFLAARVADCERAGISRERLLIDPGFGFGKTLAHNLALLRALPALRVAGTALLVGLSRKRMIGAITGREVGQRAAGSAAAALLAAERGADVVRVHDVAETADALQVLASITDYG